MPMAAPTSSNTRGFDWALSDGTPVRIRPVLPTDLDGLRQGYRELSGTSRYLRFFTGGSEMSTEQARYFTNVDQHDHIAWCGVDPIFNKRGYGISRFCRNKDSPTTAEFAIAVIDEMQGKGLGTILLATLFLLAEAAQIDELYGQVLRENPIVPRWFQRLGAAVQDDDPDYLTIRWPINSANLQSSSSNSAIRFTQFLKRIRPQILPPTD